MIETDSPVCVADVLLKPYEFNAAGPDSFDCWGLVRYWYLNNYGIELDSFNYQPGQFAAISKEIDSVRDHVAWTKLDQPEDGCIVAMSRSKVLHHVGIWVEQYKSCVHAMGLDISEGAPGHVIGESLPNLKRRFSKILFFKHVDQ